jgi:hypothetical protein
MRLTKDKAEPSLRFHLNELADLGLVPTTPFITQANSGALAQAPERGDRFRLPLLTIRPTSYRVKSHFFPPSRLFQLG